AQEPCRGAKESREERQQQADGAVAQHIAGLIPLPLIGRIGQRIVPPPERDPQHLETLPLESEDFPADEAVAHLGVLVDEVGDLRHCYLYSIRPERTPRPFST